MLEITDLPPQIVAAVTAFAQRLSNHIRTHRDASLEVHERGVLEAWRAEGGAVLAGVVTAATTGADPAARPPQCVTAPNAIGEAGACNDRAEWLEHSNSLPEARTVTLSAHHATEVRLASPRPATPSSSRCPKFSGLLGRRSPAAGWPASTIPNSHVTPGG
jgi:hypothetical protein